MSRRSRIGLSWGDVESAGRVAFPFVHAAGSGVLTAFGAGALVPVITSVEQKGGLLSSTPVPARPTAVPDHSVKGADFAIVIHSDGSQPTAVARPDAVNVFGGAMFAGNGYSGVADFGNKFSFGFDSPTSVEIAVQGQKTVFSDAHQVLLCGGVSVDKKGDSVMKKGIVGTILGMIGMDGMSDRECSDFYRSSSDVLGVATPTPTRAPSPLAALSATNKYAQGTLAQASAHPAIVTPKTPVAFGFQVKTTPKGRQFTSLVPNKNRPHDPQKTLQTLHATAQRSQQVAADVIAKIDKATKVAASAAAKSVAVKRPSIVGAAAPAGRGQKIPRAAALAKSTASLASLKTKAQALQTAGKALETHATKYSKSVDSFNTKKRAGVANAQKITHIIHGIEGIGFGFEDDRWHEIVGAVGWDEISRICDHDTQDYIDDVVGGAASVIGAGVPDYNNPGYYTDGTLIPPGPGDVPDPTYPGFLTPSGAIDPNGQYGSYASGAGASSGTLASQLPGAPDYGAGQPPALSGNTIILADGSVWPQPDIDYAPDPYPNGDDPTFYDCPTDDDLPYGAIVYDGSQQPAFQGLGNFTVFQGQLPNAGPPKGGPHSGYSLHNDGWWLELKGTQPSVNYSGGHNYDHVANPDTGMVAESKKNNWGPLMGNPQATLASGGFGGDTWTRGLRFSPSGPNGPRWFWFYDRAPQWAIAGVLQAQLNDAIAQYKAAVVAGQTDYVNAQLQDKLNAQQAAAQAAAQAAQDAQLNMQQQQANAQMAVQQQQQDAQQQALMLQQAQQQQQYYGQQAQMEQQAQQLQLQYFQQHPEDMFVAQPVDQGGGYDNAATPDLSAAADSSAAYDNGLMTDDGIDWGDSGGGGSLDSPSEDDLTSEAAELFPSE